MLRVAMLRRVTARAMHTTRAARATGLVSAGDAAAAVAACAAGQEEGGTRARWGLAAASLLGAAAGSAWLWGSGRGQMAENCGIIGVVGSEDARSVVLEALTVLMNRGYDSAGIATLRSDPHAAGAGAADGGGGGERETMMVTKYASRDKTADCVDLLKANSGGHAGHHIGIGHTRWATHGARTDVNAHPHTDSKNRVAVIHNGTINNSFVLREELEQKHGVVFRSETDTEVIAQLIGQNLDKGEGLRDAVSHALSRCEGTWGLAVMSTDTPDELVAAANGSPMVIGIGQDTSYIASETAAFNKYTKNFIALQDGEIVSVRPGGETSLDVSRVEVAPDQNIQTSPAPYPHWTLKECLEQPQAIARALGYGGRMDGTRVYLGGLDRNREMLSQVQNLLITACGTSKYASQFAAKLYNELGAFNTVTVMDAAEVRSCDLPRHHGAVLAVSQSGETKDVHRVVRRSMDRNLPTMSVVNAVGSLIARTTGLGVYVNAGREIAVASTKAFTTQVTALALMGIWFHQQRQAEAAAAGDTDATGVAPITHELMEALQRLPISFGMAKRTRSVCKQKADEIQHAQHLFVLGKGYGEPIAMEGALKIKEISYIHAEGFSGGALKHGPLALIEDASGQFGATPVIAIILDDAHAELMRTAALEVKARGGIVHVITDRPDLAEQLDENPIVIPTNGILTALTAVLPLQLIAYELALLKGVNPDQPRNLAKAITVD